MRRGKRGEGGGEGGGEEVGVASNDNARAEEAMQKAEGAAKALQNVKRPTKEQVTDVLLKIDTWPLQSRPNVTPNGAPVTGFSMGLVFGLGGLGLKVSKVSQMFPALTTLLSKLNSF
jgi:hypothetical protein